MFERRPMLGLLIGLTIGISIWRISIQELSPTATEENYPSQFQQQTYRRQIPMLPSIALNNSVMQIGLGTTLKSEGRNTRSNRIGMNLNYSSFIDNHSRIINSHSVDSSGYFSTAVNADFLPKSDFRKLINLNNFKFILNQDPCVAVHSNIPNAGGAQGTSEKHETPVVLILIHSAPSNYLKRLLIRETWGSYKSPHIRVIFLLGIVNSTQLQHRLELENRMFSDMVQGNFVDAYRNMTYKHVMALKWFTYYCSDIKYILKIDDDVFVNAPFLIDFLNRPVLQRNLLFCQEQLLSRVKRSYRSKWRVSTKEYPGRYYPPYCTGYAIVYSPDVAFRLYLEAQKGPYFWIDDVHITGTLSQKANITITSATPFILSKANCNDILAGKTDSSSFLFLFSWPDISEEQARKLWKLIESRR